MTLESLLAMRRAGADILITYAAVDVARWLKSRHRRHLLPCDREDVSEQPENDQQANHAGHEPEDLADLVVFFENPEPLVSKPPPRVPCSSSFRLTPRCITMV